MMTSKILSIAACLALITLHSFVCSCEKATDPRPDVFQAGKFCDLNVSLEGFLSGTKAINQTTEREQNIRSVEVLVFNRQTGQIDASAYVRDLSVSTGSYTLGSPIKCTYGDKEVWAVVNGPLQYSSVCDNLDSFKARTVSLTDNADDGLVMVGSGKVTLNTVSSNATLEVSRLCSAVVLRRVSNKMDVAYYRDKVRILGAYLLNVPGEQRLDNGLSAKSLTDKSKWVSPNVKSADPSEAALTQETLNETLAYNAGTSQVVTLYSFPNDADASSAPQWSARASTLVVEAEINGVKSIYPVELGVLKPNTRYEVTLEIHRAGVDPDNPWQKIEFSDAVPTITIKGWATGDPVNEVI